MDSSKRAHEWLPAPEPIEGARPGRPCHTRKHRRRQRILPYHQSAACDWREPPDRPRATWWKRALESRTPRAARTLYTLGDTIPTAVQGTAHGPEGVGRPDLDQPERLQRHRPPVHQPAVAVSLLSESKVTYSWLMGRHNFKAGYEFSYLRQIIQDVNPIYGQMSFRQFVYRLCAQRLLFGAPNEIDMTNLFVAHVRQGGHFTLRAG